MIKSSLFRAAFNLLQSLECNVAVQFNSSSYTAYLEQWSQLLEIYSVNSKHLQKFGTPYGLPPLSASESVLTM